MKKVYYFLALAASIMVLDSCRKEPVPEPVIPDDQKGLIQLSMSDDAGVIKTKAGFYNGDNTEIVARISSTNGTNIRHTRTLLKASPDATQSNASTSAVQYAEVTASGEAYNRYWDDCFGRNAKLSIYAIAVPNKTGLTNSSKTLEAQLDKGNTQVSTVITNWWTDAQDNVVDWKVTTGESAQSSETIALEDLCYSNNIQASGKNGRLEWDATANPAKYKEFEYEEHSSSCTHESQKHDYYPTLTDGEMMFKLDNASVTDGPGHFDRGHMIFKHATTRITIDLIGGEGFSYTNDFTIQPQSTGKPASIDLLKMNTEGNLNIQSGVWSYLSPSEHTYMSCSTKSTGNAYAKGSIIYTLSAQVLPGFTITAGDNNNHVLSFRIDECDYHVTMNQVFNALNTAANTTASEADGSKKVTITDSNTIILEQGKNYHFSITISKKGVDALTCTLVDWIDVNASHVANNAYITFNSLMTDQNDCEHFDMYRILNTNNTITDPNHTTFDGTSQYMTGYATSPDKLSTDGNTPEITANNVISSDRKVWKTTWFFESNKSFYHFRTVNPGTVIISDETDGDFFTMYSGPVNDTYSNAELPANVGDNKYNDYHWGAIFANTTSLKYDSSKGFEEILAGPVGPTTSILNITEQHMMSNINVFLLTPADASGQYTTASVDLYDASKAGNEVSTVTITNYSGSATVRMGTGLITPTTNTPYSSSAMTKPDYNVEFGATEGQKNYLKQQTFQFPNQTSGTEPYYHISNAYSYRVVPQKLNNSGINTVGLVIQTPDENIYYVVKDLSTIKAGSVSGNSLKDDYTTGTAVETWLPGYTYNYYFILKKTGIEAMTCTIVDWVTVNADGFDVDLES